MKGTSAARESPPYSDRNGMSSGYHVHVSLCFRPSSINAAVGSALPAITVLVPFKWGETLVHILWQVAHSPQLKAAMVPHKYWESGAS